MKKITNKAVSTVVLFATVLIVGGSAVFNSIKDNGKTNTEATSVTKEVKTKDKPEAEAEDVETAGSLNLDAENPYLTYIPVYHNGEEKNLYELATEDAFIFYLKKSNCSDCQKYEGTILEKLANSDIPYVVLETSKTPKKVSGYSIESKVAVDIGIKSVPALIFMKEGKAVEKFDGEVGDGSVIEKLLTETYK